MIRVLMGVKQIDVRRRAEFRPPGQNTFRLGDSLEDRPRTRREGAGQRQSGNKAWVLRSKGGCIHEFNDGLDDSTRRDAAEAAMMQHGANALEAVLAVHVVIQGAMRNIPRRVLWIGQCIEVDDRRTDRRRDMYRAGVVRQQQRSLGYDRGKLRQVQSSCRGNRGPADAPPDLRNQFDFRRVAREDYAKTMLFHQLAGRLGEQLDGVTSRRRRCARMDEQPASGAVQSKIAEQRRGAIPGRGGNRQHQTVVAAAIAHAGDEIELPPHLMPYQALRLVFLDPVRQADDKDSPGSGPDAMVCRPDGT